MCRVLNERKKKLGNTHEKKKKKKMTKIFPKSDEKISTQDAGSSTSSNKNKWTENHPCKT